MARSAGDESFEVLHRLYGACLCEGDGVVHLGADLALDALEVAGGEGAACGQPLGQGRNGVALLPTFDLGLVAVTVGIVHGVGAEAIGAQLKEVRASSATHR